MNMTPWENYDWKNFPEPRELTPEERKEIMEKLKDSITVEDVVALTQIDGWVSFEEALQEMEEAQKQFDQRPT
jgi:hypothetical protein